MKNMRKPLLAAATATAVTFSGTAVATANESTDQSVGVDIREPGTDEGDGEAGDGPALPGDEDDKEITGSTDFGDVFGSRDDNGNFSFDKALSSLKNVAAFGAAVAGILGVIVTLSTKIPEVLEIFGIDTPLKK